MIHDGADRKSSSIVIGRQPVLEALREGRGLERIYIFRQAEGDVIPEIRKLATELQIPINMVPVEKLNGMSRGNHQGVVAIAAVLKYADLDQTIQQIVSAGKIPLFIMLDGVTDVRNIGAIARTALCCGAQAIVIPDKGVGALNEDAVKASAGALQKLSVCRVGSLLKAIDSMHLAGFQVYASEMRVKEKLQDIDFSGPSCIVLGSEDKGIQSYITKSCDRRFRIPMSGDFDSLNVSVSAGIILFEASRQRESTAQQPQP